MRIFSILGFTVLLILLAQTHCQTPYDPNKDYNFTWLDINYNTSNMQLCQYLSTDGTYCAKCIRNLTITEIGVYQFTQCQLYFPVDNCYAFDYSFNCLLCHDGFWLNQTVNDINYCIPKTQGCQIYDSGAQKCVTCMPGWTMNTNVNSYSLLTEYYCYFVADVNCLQYDSDNHCLQCATNYILSNNNCVYLVPNCDTMSGNICTKCKTNYQLDANNNCIPIPAIQYCSVQVNYTCQSCIPGYQLLANQCIFVIDNCANVTGVVCAQCNTGYYVDPDGKCSVVPVIANCDVQVGFTCTKCTTNYQIAIDGQCIPIPQIPNCQTQVDFTCTQCSLNYQISIDGSQCQIPHIANCDIQVNFTCAQCTTGYFVTVNGNCDIIPHIDNCDIQSGFECLKCSTGYSLVNGKCSAIPQIPNCDVQVDFTCNQCSTGYTLVTNTCTVVIPHCITITGIVCTQCAQGYASSPNGHCDSYAKVPNCLLQIASSCTRCIAGYDLINEGCIYHIENCQQVSGVTCVQCKVGYSMNPNGKCTPFNPSATFDLNCKLYDKTVQKKCLSCSAGYFINGKGFCDQVDPLCKFYNPDNGFCVSCYIGYSLDSTYGKCHKSILIEQPNPEYSLNCATFNDLGQCTQCNFGYYLAQNSNGFNCQKVSELCKTFSKTTGKCTTCYLGYYLSTQGDCLKFL